MDLDLDKFIYEIKSRQAIWNMKCEAYSDRVQKVKQWEEIVDMFTDPDISIEEKRKQSQSLQKKWRNLRDSFVKERRQLVTVKSGSAAAAGKKKYKYFKQLLFLSPVISTNTKDNSLEIEENNDSFGWSSEENIIPTESTRKKKKSTPTEEIGGSELINVLKSTMQQKTQEEDPDRQFLISLVNDFKRVPMRLKPMVKINILKCIMEGQDEYDFHQTHHTRPFEGYFSRSDIRPDTRSERENSNDQPSTSSMNQVQAPTSENTESYIEDHAYYINIDTQDSD